jgi:cytochrome c
MVVALLAGAAAAQAEPAGPFPGVGRPATPKEIAAWDIDVRPDFKGLPKGSGSVAKGQGVWEGKCASCHGIFGESNEVFSALIGGTTKDDIKTGHAARLNDPHYPGRTTMMKVATVSTLWDYIHRAMPWNAPKSLSTDEVYSVTAYLLNLGGVLPDNFTLSDQNIADVQKLLPNRNGMTTDHAMWPGPEFGKRKPDVQAKACMKGCIPEPKVASFLPDFARNAHGNLAEQNRLIGEQLGADTSRPAPTALPAAGERPAPAAPAATPPAGTSGTGGGAAAANALLQKYTCVACHGVDNKIVGPAFRDVAKKYADRADVVDYLAGKIKSGGSGIWGAIPMPPQAVPDADAKLIAQWLAGGAKK